MNWHWHWRRSRQFRLMLIIGFILLILVGGVPYFVPLPTLQKAFSQAVTKSTQRTLHVHEGAYFVLLPRPAILLKKVTLSEPNRSQLFLRADRLKFDLDLWPLLSGAMHADIEGITFKNAQFDLIRKEDASYNFDNLFEATSNTSLLNLSLKAINFQGSHVNIMDANSHSMLSIDDLELGMNDLQDPKHGHLTLTGKLAVDSQQIWKGSIDGVAALRLDRKNRLLYIADLGIKVVQNYAHTTPEGWSTSVLNINGNLHYGWQPLRLSGGNLTFKSRAELTDQLWQTQLTIPGFNIAQGILSIDQATLDNTITKGQSTLTSKATIHHLIGTQHNLALHTDDARINIQLKQPSQTVQLDFKSALNVQGSQSIELPHFHVTGHYRNQSLPRGILTFSQHGQAHLHFGKENLTLISQGLLDNSPMKVDFHIHHFFVPHYQFAMKVDRLDLTPYLPAAIEGAKTLAKPEQTHDFSWLNELSAKGTIHIGTLKLQRVQMDDIQLGLKVKRGILTVSPLKASIYNGKLSGELTINNQGKAPQLRVKQWLCNVEIYPLFNDLFKLNRFDGQGCLNINIAMAGNTSADWQRTIGGTMDISLAGGTFKGLDILTQLRHTSKQLNTLTNEAVNIMPQAEYNHIKTNFSQLRARLFIQKGVIYNKDLNINAGLLHLTGEGNYDIHNHSLHYTVNANVTPLAKNNELRYLSGYTLPIYFTGNLQSPHYQLDYAHLHQQIAQQRALAQTPSLVEPTRKK